MSRIWIALLVFVLLVLTVPWWFVGSEPSDVRGLPSWAVYVLVMNVVFASGVCWLLHRFWKRFEDETGSPDSPDSP